MTSCSLLPPPPRNRFPFVLRTKITRPVSWIKPHCLTAHPTAAAKSAAWLSDGLCKVIQMDLWVKENGTLLARLDDFNDCGMPERKSVGQRQRPPRFFLEMSGSAAGWLIIVRRHSHAQNHCNAFTVHLHLL